jgi:hypothetical protein
MKPTLHRVLRILAVVALLFPVSAIASTETHEPEIVQLSYVEGDVRVSQGKSGKVDLNGLWGQATTGLSIAEGFTIATTSGRAEIEFESGWAAYLAENSTVEFKTLKAIDDIPQTDVLLLSGTLSVYFRPVSGEILNIDTPSGQAAVFTTSRSVRLESFLDALSLTMEDKNGEAIHTDDGKNPHLSQGRSVVFTRDQEIPGAWGYSKNRADWDRWVSARANQREAALTLGLQASGLSIPIPGLVELYADGKFFDCEPYGKCWEPNLAGAELPSIEGDPGPEPIPPATQPPPGNGRSTLPVPTKQAFSPSRRTETRLVPIFSRLQCPIIAEVLRGNTLDEPPVEPAQYASLCRAGSFIRSRKRSGYVWVVGKKHHHLPFHVIKYQGGRGFVPWHPRDVPGRPPINLKKGVLVASVKNPRFYEMVPASELKHVAEMRITPNEFQRPVASRLAPAERPQIHARLFSESLHDRPITEPTAPITLDFAKHSFVREPASAADRTRAAVVVARVDSQGGLKATSGSFGSRGVPESSHAAWGFASGTRSDRSLGLSGGAQGSFSSGRASGGTGFGHGSNGSGAYGGAGHGSSGGDHGSGSDGGKPSGGGHSSSGGGEGGHSSGGGGGYSGGGGERNSGGGGVGGGTSGGGRAR